MRLKQNVYLLLIAFMATMLWGCEGEDVISPNQTETIFTENFDSYITGVGIAQQGGSKWSTWNNAPGSPEDPVITSSLAYSGQKSLQLIDGNDALLLLGGKTKGKYQIDFLIYFEDSKGGYFNVLQEFNGDDSEWGMQIFFNADGIAILYAGGTSALSFYFSHNDWLPIGLFVDLDNDNASLIFDGIEMVNWQWSTGVYGSNSTKKLDAVDFYGFQQQGISGFYIDNIVFSETGILGPYEDY